MKKTIFTVLTAIMLTLSIISVSAELLSPGLLVISADDPMVVSGLMGEPVIISAEDFCRHSRVSYFDSITVSSLPDTTEGVLSIDGVAVTEGQEISFTDTNRLVFSPADSTSECSFFYTIDSAATKCSLIFTDQVNLSPEATSCIAPIEAFNGYTVSGNLLAHDPENDTLTYEITDHPKRGTVSLSKDTGSFIYTPNSTGKDSFSFIVKDSYGNYSEKCKIDFSVSTNTSGISFSDMKGNKALTAAVVMVDRGILSCSEDNGNVYFNPEENISRLDFLTSTMNTLGAANVPSVTKTDFEDDALIPDNYKGYVQSAYKLGIINGSLSENGKLYFNPDAPITRAEAAVMINNVLGYTAQTSSYFNETVPAWAEADMCAIYELGIMTSKNGEAMADTPITKAEAAMAFHRISNLVF